MTPDHFQLDPEIEGVLREVAAHPDSGLLRVSRHSALLDLREDGALASESSTGLSAAERHLVAAHREELAFALRQVAWFRLADSAPAGRRLRRRLTPETEAPLVGRRTAAAAVSDGLRSARSDASVAGIVDLCESCVRDVDQPSVRVEDLCAAAHRLVPSVRGRLIAAQSLVWAERPRASWALCRDAARRSATLELEAVALNNASDAAEMLGRIRSARELCQIASRRHPRLLAPIASRMWYAVLENDASLLERAAREFDEVCGSTPEAADEQVARFEACSSPADPSSARDGLDLLERCKDRFGPVARRLADAIHA